MLQQTSTLSSLSCKAKATLGCGSHTSQLQSHGTLQECSLLHC